MGDRGIPRDLAAHERLQQPHLHVVNAAGERFWVKYHFITDQGIEFLTQDEADRAGRRRRRLPHPRPVRGDQARGLPELDAEDADHAVRGRQDLPVQPVRPDQGVAARRLPADRGRQADPGPQPDRLPHRDRAGRVRAEQPRARHRPEPGQDAARPGVLLRRRAPRPARASTTSRSRSTRPRSPVHSYSKDGAMRVANAPTRCTRRTPRAARGADTEHYGAGGLAHRRRHGPRRLHPARRGRRLGPGRHAGPRGHGRRGPRAAGRQRRRPPARTA